MLVQADLTHGIPRDDVDAEYDRRRLDELDDHRLVGADRDDPPAWWDAEAGDAHARTGTEAYGL